MASAKLLTTAFLSLAISSIAMSQTAPLPYPLQAWDDDFCRTKGRLQDVEYGNSKIIKRILRDNKLAVPVLISQITDTGLLAKPVFCYNWPALKAGELAYFILQDLFSDETSRTMPPL